MQGTVVVAGTRNTRKAFEEPRDRARKICRIYWSKCLGKGGCKHLTNQSKEEAAANYQTCNVCKSYEIKMGAKESSSTYNPYHWEFM